MLSVINFPHLAVLPDDIDQRLSCLYSQLKRVHRVFTLTYNKYAEYKYLSLQVSEVS